MPLALILSLVLFPLVIFGLAWPVARRLMLDPAEKLCASAVLSLLAIYLVAFAIYLLGLPAMAFWTLPVLAVAGLITGRQMFLTTVRDADAKALLIGQLLVSSWCIGWLSLIASYSGGGWIGDWFEHWQRTRFFLEHWPQETQFLNYCSLPARPPLANLVVGAVIGLTGVTFSKFQLVTTLLNSLAFFPAALFARRFFAGQGPTATGGRVAIAIFTGLIMVNPSFVENTTFAWTKLITAFFILGGLYFFLRAHDPAPPPAAVPLCAVSLAAGLLAHYSAGPYVVLLAGAWFGLNRTLLNRPAFWRQTALATLIGGLILATWFGWSLMIYGTHATLLSNSAVNDASAGNQILKIAFNLRDTIVPNFLRPMDRWLIAQNSPWGYWRDWFFQLYQLNLFLIFGSVAWLVLLRELVRRWPAASPQRRWFWTWFAGGAIILGVAMIGSRDTWGLAHICLQSLMMLGLAYLAAHWTTVGRGWRLALLGGATLDFCFGIALHFGVQSNALDRWLTPARSMADTVRSYPPLVQMNFLTKASGKVEFLSDALAVPAALVLAVLAGILSLAVARARRPG